MCIRVIRPVYSVFPGLSFLLHHPQLTATIIQSLKGSVDPNEEECVPLHYASILISKGFTCSLLEIGINLEMHLRVVGTFYHKRAHALHA